MKGIRVLLKGAAGANSLFFVKPFKIVFEMYRRANVYRMHARASLQPYLIHLLNRIEKRATNKNL